MSRCTHDQMLRPIATSGLFCCDICEVDIADGTPRHTCEPCDYDLCSQCFAAKNEPISCDVHPTRPAAAAASAPPATRSPNREVGVKPSLAKILETFRVLRAEAVMGMGSLARLQDTSDDSFFSSQSANLELPWIILFISHRWETPQHPDPDGHQLGAVKAMLKATRDILQSVEVDAAACEECDEESTVARDQLLENLGETPDIVTHGPLQAATLLLRAINLCPSDEAMSTLSSADILSHIGVWYDYSCIPQDPMDEDQAATMTATLSQLDLLLTSPHVTLVALREAGDDFGSRAWCVAEGCYSLAHAHSPIWANQFPLRLPIDRLGERVVLPTDCPLIELQLKWRDRIEGLRKAVGEAKDEHAGALLELQSALQSSDSLSDIFLEAASLTANASLEDFHHSRQSAQWSMLWHTSVTTSLTTHAGSVVDLATLVNECGKVNGFKCTYAGDMTWAGILAIASLQWSKAEEDVLRKRRNGSAAEGEGAVPSARQQDFWAIAMLRHAQGKSLLVRVNRDADFKSTSLGTYLTSDALNFVDAE